MSLLTPLFLLGGLAVALPIVFHLIRRTTRERIPFSSLMFLTPTPPRVTKRSRLEHVLLLLLRCLVLGLLALGFARPFFKTEMPAPPVASNGKHVLILLDTSASMRREGLWAQATRQAKETLRTLTQPTDQLAIFRFDRSLEPLVTFEQWADTPLPDRNGLAQERLDSIDPGWASTDLSAALIQAAEVLEEAVGRAQTEGISSRKQIVLITDLQEGSRLSDLQGYEWPEGLDVTPKVVQASRPTNAGLQILNGGPEPTDLPRVRVSNASDSESEQFQLSWAKDKTPIGPVIQVYVPPGRSRVIQAPTQPSGATALRLDGDADGFDNMAYVGKPSSVTIPVLYLGRESETDASSSLYYLKRAFRESGRRQVHLLSGPADQVFDAPEAAQARLLVITDVPGPATIQKLRQSLEEGKTLLWVMESAGSASALASLLAVNSIPAQEANVADYAMWGRIDFQHPLFAAFADPRFSDFTKIHTWKYRRVDFTSVPEAQEVVRFDLGDPAWVQIRMGPGAVHVLTTSWRPSDSQLGLSSKFVPLLYLLLDQSGAPGLAPDTYTVGEAVSFESTGPSTPWTIRSPDGTETSIAPGARFFKTDVPGLYEGVRTNQTQQFAVNIASDESRTAPLELERLEQLGIPLHSVVTENEKRAAERRSMLQAGELENRQKLWRWLLAGAVVILFLESWLAGRLSRATPQPLGAQTS